MNYYLDRSLYVVRRIYRSLTKSIYNDILSNPNAVKGQEASDLIYEILSKDEPCMISRFGSTELETIMSYLIIHNRQNNIVSKYIEFLFKNGSVPFWSSRIKYSICTFSGFFSIDKISDDILDKFCQLYLDCMKDVDILGSWLRHEEEVKDRLPNAKYVPLNDLEPYNHLNPWSRILRGKKVLVIHPFSYTIKSQYKNREKLFKNRDVLPEFHLETINAVQSIAGNIPKGYSNWFDALEDMKEQISTKDFDVALIGCGAYGFPLASYIKNIGKQAIHLGGALQIFFGIKGLRWTQSGFDKKFYNECWVSPSESDKPENFKNVEDGCYW